MRYIFLKTITFHLFFLLLHFAHDWLPYKGVTVIAASSESVMQHMKVAFSRGRSRHWASWRCGGVRGGGGLTRTC